MALDECKSRTYKHPTFPESIYKNMPPSLSSSKMRREWQGRSILTSTSRKREKRGSAWLVHAKTLNPKMVNSTSH